MRSAIAFCAFILACISAGAQIIPQERLTDWSLSGIRDSADAPELFIDFSKTGGISNGTEANDSVFRQLLSTVKGKSTVLFFPKGTYLFNESMELPSDFILRGQGSDSTKLIFDLNKEDHLVRILGLKGSEESSITASLKKDAYEIRVADAQLFKTGDYIRVSDNDEDLVTSDWALQYSGQIVRIKYISGDTLFLASPLRRNYDLENEPKIRRLEPAKHTGIENIGIVRLDATEEQTSNIQFNYAADCWVKCIESENCNFAHIEISNSTNIDVSGSYLHHAFAYGGGGQGYGIALQYTSGECRVQNTIFNTLRHSILLQAGANGNVISYNHSVNPMWDELLAPKNSAGDIVLHGNYPYANLFEGNAVQNIVIDNSHGKNGMHNTFFRNRAALYGIVITDNGAENLNFIGNEITHPVLGYYILKGKGHLQHANNKSGKILPSETDSLTEESLYLTETPDYYKRRSAWPPVGWPNAANGHKIQAEDLFEMGFFTPCLAPTDTFGDRDTTYQDTTGTDTTSFIPENFMVDNEYVMIYPNPTQHIVTVKAGNADVLMVKEVRVVNAAGQEVSSHRDTDRIDMGGYPDGVYLFFIRLSSGEAAAKKVMKVRY